MKARLQRARLISNLKLNLKVVYAGGEASQITQVKQAYAQKKPILFYWYTPQWLNAELKLTEVMLPARTPGCDAVASKTNCAYPSYDLRKVISTKFAKSGSPAVNVIKKFSWTAQDQNAVAVMIAGKPNVGKSSLLNRLVGEKIAIVSPKPQTTRKRITGMVTRPEGQIAFVDTPGIHEAKGELNRFMVEAALAE